MAHVLVIEGDASLRALYAAELTRRGHTVTLTGKGSEGIVSARKDSPALIMLDIDLKDMDGLTVLKDLSINAKTKRTPVAVSSYREDDALIKAAFGLGAIDFVSLKGSTPKAYVEKMISTVSGLKADSDLAALKKSATKETVAALAPSKFFTKTIAYELALKELTDLGLSRPEAASELAKPAKAKTVIIAEDEFFGRMFKHKLESVGLSAFVGGPGEITELLAKLSPRAVILDVKYPHDYLAQIKASSAGYVYLVNNKDECRGDKLCFARTESTPAAIVQAVRRLM